MRVPYIKDIETFFPFLKDFGIFLKENPAENSTRLGTTKKGPLHK